MSMAEDYKSTRLRRNAELASAVSSVRKDLYDWKPTVGGGAKITTAGSRPTSGRTTPSFPQPPPKLKSLNSNSLVKKTSSLKDLNVKVKKQSKDGRSRIPADQEVSQISLDRPASSNKSEFLTGFASRAGSGIIKREDSDDITSERAYLTSRRSVRDAASRDSATLDQELVIKLNKKESLSVNEMDLSQFNLKSMKNLEKFAYLKLLDLSCNRITKLEYLAFEQLTELRLYGNQIEQLDNLDRLPELQCLQLQSNKIKRVGRALQQLKKLEYLRLDNNRLETISAAEISPCSNLSYLNVSNNQIDSLAFIHCLPNLEELDASHLKLRNGLNDIDPHRCRNLTGLDVSHNQLTDRSLVNFAGFKSLNNLNLSHNAIKSVEHVRQAIQLRELDLAENSIDEVLSLSALPDLQVLDISGNRVSQWSQIESLVRCAQLFELNIKNNPVMNEKSRVDVEIALPSIRLIDQIYVDRIEKNNTIARSESRDKNLAEMSSMQAEMNRLNNQADTFNKTFLKKYEELQRTFDRMITVSDLPDNKKSILDRGNSICSNDSDGLDTKAILSDRSSSAKNKQRLDAALAYGKQQS